MSPAEALRDVCRHFCGPSARSTGLHDDACAALRAAFSDCQSEERVMHICGDPDLCEETDERPAVDLLGPPGPPNPPRDPREFRQMG